MACYRGWKKGRERKAASGISFREDRGYFRKADKPI